MSINELETRIIKLKEWEEIADQATAEANAIRESIKAEMQAREVEELPAGRFVVRWTSVISNRFDTTSFKRVYGELYNSFCHAVESKRFSISA